MSPLPSRVALGQAGPSRAAGGAGSLGAGRPRRMGLRRGAEGGGPALLAAAAASTPSAVIIGLQEHAARRLTRRRATATGVRDGGDSVPPGGLARASAATAGMLDGGERARRPAAQPWPATGDEGSRLRQGLATRRAAAAAKGVHDDGAHVSVGGGGVEGGSQCQIDCRESA